MQPEPVQRSNTESGRVLEGETMLARRRAQCSVSGRGIRVSGRERRLSGPNGVVPGVVMMRQDETLVATTYPRCTGVVHLVTFARA